ncbi:MAG TPA: DUF427 domain-containing protein [Pseudomonadales bacterium]|nr:DUF427 domain-containing protein [Pseudomonadales bacterium]
MAFELHPRLAADAIGVGHLPLCNLLLNNDSRFPWCILVPRLEGLRDFHEIPPQHRDALFAEIERVSIALQQIANADKMNVAALGNMVPQLHIHVIARHTTDAAWPSPVWSAPGATPYADPQPMIDRLRARLELHPAPGFAQHPRHRVDITPARAQVEVEFGGVVIAKTQNALLVDESRHDLVYYVPRRDVRMDLLTATQHDSYCPFKGTARYWTIAVGERRAENAVWAYDEPYDEALPLRDHAAFYTDRVDRITIDGKSDR